MRLLSDVKPAVVVAATVVDDAEARHKRDEATRKRGEDERRANATRRAEEDERNARAQRAEEEDRRARRQREQDDADRRRRDDDSSSSSSSSSSSDYGSGGSSSGGFGPERSVSVTANGHMGFADWDAKTGGYQSVSLSITPK